MSCKKCGTAFDENGVCPSCGAKQLKGKGYRIGHSILCCILTLLLTVTLISLAAARSILNGTVVDDSVEQLDLATLPVGRFVGAEDAEQNLAGYLLDEYVTDKDITEEEVATMLKDLGAEAVIQEKTNAYLSLFRGTSDEIPTLTSAEIVELLEKNEDKILTTFAITIEPSDKELIASELDPIMNAVNDSMKTNYGSKFSRSVSRFWLSTPCFVILILLGLVIMIRWCVVYKKSTGAASKGVRAFGISSLIPAALMLIIGVAALIFSASLPDADTANRILITLFNGTGEAFAMFSGICVLVSIFLIILSKLLAFERKPAAATSNASIENSPIVQEAAASAPVQEMPQSAPQTESAPALPCCPNCGKQAFKAEQKFCMSCGSAMQIAAPAPAPETDPVISLDKPEAESAEPVLTDDTPSETTI